MKSIMTALLFAVGVTGVSGLTGPSGRHVVTKDDVPKECIKNDALNRFDCPEGTTGPIHN